ncbi:MAG: histidine phosphatase family protein [Verrucomicrobia bacterium]|nr:histidine phosphatase family protein [Verrucomicrobiota bacterium]
MLWKKIVLWAAGSALCLNPLFAEEQEREYQKLSQLKSELGLNVSSSEEENEIHYCHLYLVHHGDTEYTVEKRLQGWIDIPLNEKGKAQMSYLAKQYSSLKIDAIYSSSLLRATQSAEILAKGHDCPIVILPALKGEAHGNLEGLKKNEYENDPHFQKYNDLSPEEVIFFSVGEGGESKADVARRAIPAIHEICLKHPGKNVVIVTHGGVLKFLNFLLGNYSPEEIDDVPHGQLLRLEGDGQHLRLSS